MSTFMLCDGCSSAGVWGVIRRLERFRCKFSALDSARSVLSIRPQTWRLVAQGLGWRVKDLHDQPACISGSSKGNDGASFDLNLIGAYMYSSLMEWLERNRKGLNAKFLYSKMWTEFVQVNLTCLLCISVPKSSPHFDPFFPRLCSHIAPRQRDPGAGAAGTGRSPSLLSSPQRTHPADERARKAVLLARHLPWVRV